MWQCEHCWQNNSDQAKACSACGTRRAKPARNAAQKKRLVLPVLIGLAAVVIVIVLLCLMPPSPGQSYRRGLHRLRTGNLPVAQEKFSACSGYMGADTALDVLRLTEASQYRAAAKLALDTADDGEEAIPKAIWERFFDVYLFVTDGTDLTAYLNKGVVDNLFKSPKWSPDMEESFLASIRAWGSMLRTDPFDGECEIENLKSLYSQCGTEPAGKLLILVQHTPHDETPRSVLSTDLMAHLPPSLYPASLAEVEYVLLITYSYEEDGWYSDSVNGYMVRTDALCERAEVKLLHCPDEELIWASKSLEGPPSPSSYSYSGNTPPAYLSGGAPDAGKVADAIYAALELIMPA